MNRTYSSREEYQRATPYVVVVTEGFRRDAERREESAYATRAAAEAKAERITPRYEAEVVTRSEWECEQAGPVHATCEHVGTLRLRNDAPLLANPGDPNDGTIWARGLADYTIRTVEGLHYRASSYRYVRRPNGKTVRGDSYSRRMALNDFRALTS